MEFTVRVNGVDIICRTPEELDFVVNRYGDKTPRPAPVNGSATKTESKRTGNGHSNDETLLIAFLKAGDGGVPAGTIGALIERAVGRGMPVALKKWAVRLGLTTEDGPDACVKLEGAGYELTDGAKEVAKLRHGALIAPRGEVAPS